MSDRQLIADLLSALEYHEEQTRPIHSTTLAIQVAREYLRQGGTQRKPLTDEEIEACRQQGYDHDGLHSPFDFREAARAVERALEAKNGR